MKHVLKCVSHVTYYSNYHHEMRDGVVTINTSSSATFTDIARIGGWNYYVSSVFPNPWYSISQNEYYRLMLNFEPHTAIDSNYKIVSASLNFNATSGVSYTINLREEPDANRQVLGAIPAGQKAISLLGMATSYYLWPSSVPSHNAGSVNISPIGSPDAPYLELTLQLLPPTLKQPIGGYVDVASPIKFEWVAPIQAEARVTFYQNGAAVLTDTTGASSRSYTVPAGTFDRYKSLQWTAQVRDGDGTWSENAPIITLITIPAVPDMPDLIRPVGIALDTASEIAFKWAHRSSDGSTQHQAILQTSADRGATWIAHTIGEESERAFPTDSFPPGTHLWRVQTLNIENQAGPWSATAEFYVYGRPDPPTITSITPDTAKPTISWGSSDQASYEIEIYSGEERIYHQYVVGADRDHAVTDFLNDGRHIIQLRVTSGYGLISDWTIAQLLVSTVKPAAPTLFVAEHRDSNRVIVDVADENTATILIYRTRIDAPHAEGMFDDAKTVIIASSSTTRLVFDDYSAASNTRYGYIARAVTEGNTFEDSSIAVGVHHIRGSLFSLASDPSKYLVNIIRNIGAPVSRENAVALTGTAIYYVGRKLPVYEFSEFSASRWTLNAMFDTGEQLKTFNQLLATRGTILYRDQYGRKMYINIQANSLAPDRIGTKFSLPFEEVDYHE